MKISKRFFNTTVKIQSKATVTSTGVDASGTFTLVWTDVTGLKTLKGYLRWLIGIERVYLDKETYFRDAIFYCDYNSTTSVITKKHRLVYSSKNYEIVDVKNTGEQDEHLAISIKREE